jgi:hypothetical protein
MQDIFITFVADDKGLANSLSDDLEESGMSVSRRRLRLGDSLSANVEDGFQEATFGVLILSQALFSLPWPSQEISTVVSIAHDPSLADRFLAVWHKIEPTELSGISADLARLPGLSTEIGVDKVAQEIAGATRAAKAGSATTKQAPYTQMPMEQVAPLSSDPNRLAEVLRDQFSLGELQDLSYELGVDFEALGGESKAQKSRELILYLQRRGKLDLLVEDVMRRRPYLR